MGVCCVVVRLKDETIDELLAMPRKLWHFYSSDDIPEPRPPSLVGRMLGFKAEPYPECSAPREEGDYVDLDKSWRGIDSLLSNCGKDSGDCRLLTMKGEKIGEEVGYGCPQAFRSPVVRDFHHFLATTPSEIVRDRYKGEPTEFECYLAPNYELLKAFIAGTAALGQGVIIFNV
jgi:Domain of unknown function (DUF1877)